MAILASKLGSTCRSGRAWAVLIIVTVLGLAADLGTKWYAFERVGPEPVQIAADGSLVNAAGERVDTSRAVVVVPRVLEFTLVANPGAVFGMGAGKRVFFIIFTLAALGMGVVLFCSWTTSREHLAHGAIGLLLSGGLGNLYDRMLFGRVRDFIHPLPHVKLPFGWSYPWGGDEVWPYVSNVADLFLIVGIGILVVRAMRTPSPASPPATPPPPGAQAG